MRYPLTFFSVVALIWCSCCVLRSSVSWTVCACVISQTFFGLLSVLALQKHRPEGGAYELFFGAGIGAILLFACWFALKSSTPSFALVTAVWCACLALFLLQKKPSNPMLIYFGAGLIWCGVLAIVSLSENLRPEASYSTFALGMFWLLLGIVFVCCSVGAVRNQALWQLIGDLLPPTLVIVCFGGLAFMLWGGPQAELSRQSIPALVESR